MNRLHSPRVARSLALVAVAYATYYVVWRALATLNPAALTFSILFLLAEFYGAVRLALLTFVAWDTGRRPRFQLQLGLHVDVFVPTLDDDLDALQATLVGCQAITYPHVTYVLDAGRRTVVAQLAERLRCRYLAQGDNVHGWTGSVNAALSRTAGELIVILGAGTVPQPDILERTLGYFADNDVAFVQLPRLFHNVDSALHDPHADGVEPWHEQALSNHVIGPGSNRWNAAPWLGSPSIVRRAALSAVGDVAPHDASANLRTSIRLHASAWKSVYCDEPLAFGFAPRTLHAFLVDRVRWAREAAQILLSRTNPVIVPGLTLPQRLTYLDSLLTQFDPLPKIVFLGTPAAILVTGVVPLRIGALAFVAHWLPFIALATLADHALGRGFYKILSVEKFNHLRMLGLVRAVIRPLWPAGLHFTASQGSESLLERNRDRQLLIPVAVLIATQIVAGLVGVARLSRALVSSPDSSWFTLLGFAWATVNALILAAGGATILHRQYRRQAYRTPVTLNATLQFDDGRVASASVQDLSLAGARVTTSSSLGGSQQLEITIDLPDGPLQARVEVTNAQRTEGVTTSRGVRLIVDDPAMRDRLLAFLFITIPRHQTRKSATILTADPETSTEPTAGTTPLPSSLTVALPGDAASGGLPRIP